MSGDNGGIKWTTQGATDWRSPFALKSSWQYRIQWEDRAENSETNGKAVGQTTPAAVKKEDRSLHITDRSERIWRSLRTITQAYPILVMLHITYARNRVLNECLVVHSSVTLEIVPTECCCPPTLITIMEDCHFHYKEDSTSVSVPSIYFHLLHKSNPWTTKWTINSHGLSIIF